MTSPSRSDSPAAATSRARYWRSLQELHQDDAFVEDFLHREFPVAASELPDGVSRRRWMQIMGASLSLAGAAGCRYPTEIIAPFVIRPEGRIPGESYGRSTNFELAGRVHNLTVTNVDGRPIKVEGNADHPGGRGGTDAYVQASILGLYDPDRARDDALPLRLREQRGKGVGADWEAFDTYARGLVRMAETDGGARFAVLMPPTQSPSLARMVGKLRERLPQATLCRFDGVHGDVMREATLAAIGKAGRQSLDLSGAKIVLTVEADILGNDPGFVRNAHGYAESRDPAGGMSRLYVVEGGYTNTGAAADTRLALRPSQMTALLAEIERRLDAASDATADASSPAEVGFDELEPAVQLETFLEVLASDLTAAGDSAVVVVGESLGAQAVAAGIRINSKLGSLGKLQKFVPLADAELGDVVSLVDLATQLRGGKIESLLILGDNPAYAAPGDVAIGEALASVENSVYLGEYDDETAVLCRWSLPQAHPLESWGDCIADDGSYGVGQPQILPLLGGRSAIELIAIMLDEDEISGDAIVRRTVDELAGAALSERQWRKLLHDGFHEEIRLDHLEAAYVGTSDSLTDAAPVATLEVDQDRIDVLFVPADGLYDGRFANNGWLQELPQTLTKVTWDNVAIMSPRTARELKVKDSSIVALRRGDTSLELPVYEMPGCAPGVVTVAFGYGRVRAGMVGGFEGQGVDVVGTNLSPLRRADQMRFAGDIEARPRYRDHTIASTQNHWAIDELGKGETQDRSFSLIREGTLPLLEKNPHFVEDKGPHVPKVGVEGSPFREVMAVIRETRPHLPQWGMTIDLNKCIGCNACVVACQSENNVPIVGKEQVIRSREMHWIRVDRYFQGNEDQAGIVQQPMACQHCETAPCEQVCPVAATVHTDEGLNAMAYNRCIGTRYCANNCPYKVRRFNYFNYNSEVGVGYGIDAFPGNIENANRKLQAMVLNPEVTVRGRGVMEKCTFCVQRIEKGKIEARKNGEHQIRDGAIKTACQMACPSGAIEFGNLTDPEAAVTRLQADQRAYGVLTQLNTKPRTLYLAKIRNPHPRLMTSFQLRDLVDYAEPKHHGHDDHGHGDHGHGDHGHDETETPADAAAGS
ncbi:MAG: 4Fe-4S dicluster domain-containing protein [Planctomycetaceae bacterium]|nr:MAG: 4Fe-4S dicluster domain-containing protein [Planctomycetaceae bacterium]